MVSLELSWRLRELCFTPYKGAQVGCSLENPEQLNCSSHLSCEKGLGAQGTPIISCESGWGNPRAPIFPEEARLFRVGNNFLVLNCQPRALEFPCLAFAEHLGTVSGHTRNQASVTGKDRRRRGPSLLGAHGG